MEREYLQNELTKSFRHIHTASAFVRSSRLPYLQEVGELTVLAPHTSSRSNLPSRPYWGQPPLTIFGYCCIGSDMLPRT